MLNIMSAALATAMVPGDQADLRNSLYCLAHDCLAFLGEPIPGRVSLLVSRERGAEAGQGDLWIFVPQGVSSYQLFAVAISGPRMRDYRIVNNGAIRWDGRTLDETKPLLGGIWAHDAMRRNFARARRRGAISVAVPGKLTDAARCLGWQG